MYEETNQASLGKIAKPNVEPPSPMADAFQRIGGYQSHTADLLGLLEKRLDVALRPPNDAGNKAECGQASINKAECGQASICRLHGLALDVATRQEQINERLQELIDRIGL